MTNRKLRKALLDQHGISPQLLSYRVQKIKKKYSMTTEDATYVIAQQEGIILDKYLDKDTVDRIRDIMYRISPVSEAPRGKPRGISSAA
jgi:hypothetical protein